MSGRKAGAMGLVERLAAALAVNEIIRSRRFLGEHTSKEDREELLKLTASELTSTAQVLASAVHLRQQVETAEFTRALIEQQKAAQRAAKQKVEEAPAVEEAPKKRGLFGNGFRLPKKQEAEPVEAKTSDKDSTK